MADDIATATKLVMNGDLIDEVAQYLPGLAIDSTG